MDLLSIRKKTKRGRGMLCSKWEWTASCAQETRFKASLPSFPSPIYYVRYHKISVTFQFCVPETSYFSGTFLSHFTSVSSTSSASAGEPLLQCHTLSRMVTNECTSWWAVQGGKAALKGCPCVYLQQHENICLACTS